jgi:hypothetical protein
MLNGLFLLTLLLLAYVGAIGFATVWLRHRISVTANAGKVLEQRIVELQRSVNEVTAEIATAESPEQLQRQNIVLGLHLVRPREEQVFRVSDGVEPRLAAKRFGPLLGVNAADPARGGLQTTRPE